MKQEVIGLTCGVLAMLLTQATPSYAQVKTGEPRRDVAGKKGISPFREAIKKGDDAFLARDYDGAFQAYQGAIKLQSKDPLGHYRVAELHKAKGEFDLAIESLATAMRFSNKLTMRAKMVFLQADIRERQAKLRQAKRRWEEYQRLSGQETTVVDLDSEEETETESGPNAILYPAVAQERLKQLEAKETRDREYAAVKERIAKREAGLDKKTRGK